MYCIFNHISYLPLKSGNACYHSVQNLLSSSSLSKNLKIKIYRNIILPVVCYGTNHIFCIRQILEKK
jgi:hypothetical protein